EIGGSFRIPDVMEESGASLVAVGTTNKTHLEDYERAITEETAALLKVHTSNYRILGFTSSVDAKDLSSLKDKYQLPLIEDLGSGILIDLSKYGIDYEPTVQDSLKKGVDVVTFSGDKLLGGPQAGIIVGKKKYIEEMKRNPLTRALRVDKFTLTALETILKLYLEEEKAVEKIPTLRMLTLGLEKIDKRAKKLFKEIKDLNLDKDLEIAIEDSYSEVGGGSMPLVKLDSRSLVLSCKSISSQELEKRLRSLKLPIITRLYRDKIYMDLRTIKEEEIPLISQGIKEVFKIKESQL
ncbi:MAG TPA: L-seryl-tRNA(Sec) selenium transferase, partial [Tissierellaceae bacterium]|nr:L-seryl-tRNA(Sec) selenium transferase [Tissierellaceae bacterium]